MSVRIARAACQVDRLILDPDSGEEDDFRIVIVGMLDRAVIAAASPVRCLEFQNGSHRGLPRSMHTPYAVQGSIKQLARLTVR